MLVFLFFFPFTIELESAFDVFAFPFKIELETDKIRQVDKYAVLSDIA